MASYTTNLKAWGATGQEFPDGYSYLEDEAPVDAWDNFLTSNLISDVKDHLIPLTNSRIESDSGIGGGEPSSPEASHLYHDTDNEALKYWNATDSVWNRVLSAGGDVLAGALNFDGYAAQNVGPIDLSGNLDVAGQDVVDGATTLYNSTTGQFSDADTVDGLDASDISSGASDSGTSILSRVTDFNFGANLSVAEDGDGTVTIDASKATDTHTSVSEDGTQVYASVDDIDFTGHLNVIDDADGTITIDPAHTHDSRYLKTDGSNEMSGNLNLSGNTLTDSTQGYLDLTGDGNDLRLATGQAIEDGSGNSRVTLSSTTLDIHDSTGVKRAEYDDSGNHTIEGELTENASL